MAHPFRLTLLDLAERRGTLTSAEASAATGESTASCSFHLRQLAKYGYLEPAEARNGRERPWKRATLVERVPDSDDPALGRAAAEALKVIVDRFANDASYWLETMAEHPRAWRAGSVLDDELLYLTASELRELSRAVLELFGRYRARTSESASRPPGARAVRAAALLFPLPDDDARER
jgi:hypothetical protein